MVDLQSLYRVLLRIVKTNDTITYEDLSIALRVETGVDVSRRSWGEWLGQVSRRCARAGFPPISSVVVSATDKMPGDGYWGLPGAPPHKDFNAWNAVLQQIYASTWPAILPP